MAHRESIQGFGRLSAVALRGFYMAYMDWMVLFRRCSEEGSYNVCFLNNFSLVLESLLVDTGQKNMLTVLS